MPSALAASRTFLSNAIARTRAGVQNYARGVSEPGPDIKIDPFGPGQASTAAGLARTGAAVGAAMRSRANFQLSRQTAMSRMQLLQAQIAQARAHADFFEGLGRQTSRAPSAPVPIHLTRDIGPYKAGTDVDPRELHGHLTAQAQLDANQRASERIASAHRYQAAVAALRELDTDRERHVSAGEGYYRAQLSQLIGQASDPKNKNRAQAISALGYDPTDIAQLGSGAAHTAAFNNLIQSYRDRTRANYEGQPDVKAKRASYQATIDGEAANLRAAAAAPPAAPVPAEDAGAAADPRDTLGVLPFLPEPAPAVPDDQQ